MRTTCKRILNVIRMVTEIEMIRIYTISSLKTGMT